MILLGAGGVLFFLGWSVSRRRWNFQSWRRLHLSSCGEREGGVFILFLSYHISKTSHGFLNLGEGCVFPASAVFFPAMDTVPPDGVTAVFIRFHIENLQHICTFRLSQTQQGEWTSYQIKLTQGGANLLSNKTRGSKPPIKQKQGGDLLSNIIIQASSLSTINPQHFFNKGSEPLIRQNSHKEEQTSYQTKPGGENLLTNKIRREISYQILSISNIIKY